MALGMIERSSRSGQRFGETLEVRIGIHSGDVVAGIIGQHRFIYDVWGDTVNTASRLILRLTQSHSDIEATYQRVRDTFHCELRGQVPLKGKGVMLTYFLGGRVNSPS